MSEKISLQGPELLPSPEKHELLAAHSAREQGGSKSKQEKSQAEAALEARQNIDETASSDNPFERVISEEKPAAPLQPSQISRQLQQITLRRELKHIRSRLPARQRALSRVVHQPAVKVVSQAASQTVSRPSGLLGGGLVAFFGSLVYLYLAHHIGFRYNYALFTLLFVGGFGLGLILELIVYSVFGRRKAAD